MRWKTIATMAVAAYSDAMCWAIDTSEVGRGVCRRMQMQYIHCDT